MNHIDIVLKLLNNICPYAHIERDTELIDSEILTSIDLFDFIIELESTLDIRIPEELISAENFATARTIARTILGEAAC